MKCASLGEYHDVYLATDVLLLTSVFEAFRICYETYGQDCACYFMADNLAGYAFIKVCNTDLKLLTEREHLDMVKKKIRGGMSPISTRRFFKANKYLEDYNPEEPSSYRGGIMKHCPLE